MAHVAQRERALMLLVYIAILFGVSYLLFQRWVPPLDENGLWFYAALANLLLGNLLLTPFFTKPVDAISYSVVALLTLRGATGAIYASGDRTLKHIYWGVESYIIVVLASAVLLLLVQGGNNKALQRISVILYEVATEFGGCTLIFSVLYFFLLLAFHRDSVRTFVALVFLWLFIAILRPLENAGRIIGTLRKQWRAGSPERIIGQLLANQFPGVFLIEKTGGVTCTFGAIVASRGEAGAFQYGLVLDELSLAGRTWLRAYELAGANVIDSIRTSANRSAFQDGSTIELSGGFCTSQDLDASFQTVKLYQNRKDLVGIVSKDTDTAILRFEVVRTDADLQEGRLVSVQMGTADVLYQIINGYTQEEILNQKNHYGYVRAHARKIGFWNPARTRFEYAPWVPKPNAPVYLVPATNAVVSPDAVGVVPRTKYEVTVQIDPLVTHNTAILGILGAGKSFLALELVERMLLNSVKVLCLDLTGQYQKELSPYFDAAAEQAAINKIAQVGPPGRTKPNQNQAEGGSVKDFEAAVQADVDAFIASASLLKIYNPSEFEVWKQDSKLFSGSASMAQLTPTEVTRFIVECALKAISTQTSEKARLCVVLEEAHSLVPEWNAVASEGDRTAANGTSKAILQGRKFGMGTLLVTQRTANVTKTILNQCNTVFALRTFDATGMEFLRNYIGPEYAGILSTLPDRQAVVFGRASSCSEPVQVRLNDRDKFLQDHRAPAVASATVSSP